MKVWSCENRARFWSCWGVSMWLSRLKGLPLIAIAAVGSANDGFFATSFGWTALAFAGAAIILVVIAAPVWGWFDRVWLTAAACLCVYALLSAAWAGSAGDAVDAGLRTLVYLSAIAGVLLVLRRGDLSCWLAGLMLGVAGVCVYCSRRACSRRTLEA